MRPKPIAYITPKPASGGGPVLDIGVHRIDAAWYLMGNPKPVRISAVTANRLGEFQTKGIECWKGVLLQDNRNDTEDFGAGVIHFENGAILLFECSWALNGPDFHHTQIFGTKAGISLDPLTIYGERNHYLSNELLIPPKGKAFDFEIAHFIECIQTGKEPKVSIDHAYELQRILQGIYDSAKLGREVTL
jgi:predicted dehydrogenase